MDTERAILHVDMDAFYASVEQLDNPELRGKPVLVGGGVVTAASYEARKFGCHSAQPIAEAKRLCPQAIIVHGRHQRYHEISQQVFAILHDFTPLVEGLSIDEAFLDVTGSQRLLGDAVTIARNIKKRILAETGLTASVGVAPNKFLAKIASDLNKPDGLTIITPDDLDTLVADLPIKRMWGVGPVMEDRLARLSIRTFGDLRTIDADLLRQRLGEGAEHLQKLAWGIDDRPVHTGHGVKSISKESTHFQRLKNPEDVRRQLLIHVERVAERLRHKAMRGRTVTVKIRFGSFQTITRSATLSEVTDRTDLLWMEGRRLFDTWAKREFLPVRLIGFGVSHLEDERGRQIDLFPDEQDQRRRRLDRATDAIRDRFGRDAIHRGGGAYDREKA
ncbi:MAG: DNA polymerase IV [Phycisphaerales bacterium]|nr:MAG: DNA polymerase IV [Phycisphaerales bacterium]